MIKISHRYFDVDYDMSNIVIKDCHKHFDVEYDMKVKFQFQFFNFFCNASLKKIVDNN
jgi:hypothetical protein